MEKEIEKEFWDFYNEARRATIKGWDFSYIKDRMISEPPPWDYKQVVLSYIKKSNYLLDMGTGGGEFLSTLRPLPKYTYATEAYPPNIPIAKRKLKKLGIKVVPVINHEKLPLKSDFFDLIINRHEEYSPQEVLRILKPNGIFITQQVGHHDNIELNQFFGEETYKNEIWNLEYASKQLRSNGFELLDSKEALFEEYFKDIGAIIFYLRIISWQIPNFDIEENIGKLKELHSIIQETGKFMTHGHRFLVIAKRI